MTDHYDNWPYNRLHTWPARIAFVVGWVTFCFGVAVALALLTPWPLIFVTIVLAVCVLVIRFDN